eukprot:m.346490 g.346490  ORF g.346490 m.346490 type:complete len:261 (+) comp27911_c3_seq1:244-1026(+)
MPIKFKIWKLEFDGKKKSHKASAIGLLALLIFDISALSSPSMIELEGTTFDFRGYLGAFRTDCEGSGVNSCTGIRDHEVICSEQNKGWIGFGRGASTSDTDCTKALSSKCYSSQFFLLFGFFCHVISIAVPFTPKPAVPHVAGLAALLCAALSYFIVWCIWASIKANKLEPNESDCGLTEMPGVTDRLGGAFYCTVLAWLACCAQFAMYMGGRNDGAKPASDKDDMAVIGGGKEVEPAVNGTTEPLPPAPVPPPGESSKV